MAIDQFGQDMRGKLDAALAGGGGGKSGKAGIAKIGSSPGEIKDKAASLRAAATKQLRTIQGNPDLKPEAKTRLTEELKKETNAHLLELRSRFARAVDAEHADLRRSFILPQYSQRGDTVSIRDAVTKATAIQTEAEARKLLDRARVVGDLTLERSIVFEARAKAWRGLVNDWSGSDPEGAADLQALNESEDKLNSPGQKITDALNFTEVA